eukprot:gene4414-4835_t
MPRIRKGITSPKRLVIFRKSKALRRWLVRNPWIRPLCVFNYAAVTIQKVIRGFLVRRLQRSRSVVGKKEKRGRQVANRQLDKYLRFLDQTKQRSNERAFPWLNGGFSAWCAVAAIVIQSFWKEISERRSVVIQREKSARGRFAESASKIQRCWRAYCCRRIYRYFRDLIQHKLRAAPADLLRTIIPQESFCLDRAAGIHVRFRLGGWMFPPKVYFKIYTHRPLCDVNAFAPRCYVKERPVDSTLANNKAEYAKLRVRKGAGAMRVGVRYFDTIVSTTCPEALQEWYRREDNNPWRAISSQLIDKVSPLPWFQDTVDDYRAPPKAFHFDRVQRKQLQQQTRRRRKRDWMVKLYSLTAETKDMEYKSDAKSNGKSIKEQISWPETEEKRPFGAIDAKRLPAEAKDDEIEEMAEADLLRWSLALDYDSYTKQWSEMGTSLPSDMMSSFPVYVSTRK